MSFWLNELWNRNNPNDQTEEDWKFGGNRYLYDRLGVDPRGGGSGLDEFGFPISGMLPDGAIAPQVQAFANRQAYRWNDARARDAQMILQQGLDTLGSYRPGGVAQLTSPYYSQMASTELQRRIDPPDLMYWDRRDAEMRAQKRAEQAAWLSFGSQIVGTALGAAVGGPGNAGGDTTSPTPDQLQAQYGGSGNWTYGGQNQGGSLLGDQSGGGGGGVLASTSGGGKDSQTMGGQPPPGGADRQGKQAPGVAGQPRPENGPAGPGNAPMAGLGRDAGFTAMAGQEFIPTGTAQQLAAPLGMSGDDLMDAALVSDPELTGEAWNDWMMGWLDAFTVQGTTQGV